MINRDKFFPAIRPQFGGKLSQPQVDGITAILNAWDGLGGGDLRWLAYMLTTVFWETARQMQPVRETLADSDDRAIAILDRSWAAGRMPQVKTPYWRKDADGKSWLGRGFVQLTFKANYERAAKGTGADLVGHPELAMQPGVAAAILFKGMAEGWFTGKKLGDYFHGDFEDWRHARRIINGLDSADEIAASGKAFLAALKAA